MTTRASAPTLLFFLCTLAAAAPVRAQEGGEDPNDGAGEAERPTSGGHADDIELVGWLGFGFGGTVDSTVRVDLDPSVGLGSRLELPVLDFLVIGGQFQMAFWKDHFANDRNGWFDFDALVKARHIFDVHGYALEAYALMPVGFTLTTVRGSTVDTGPGWNIGLLFGSQFYFIEDLAIVLEMGWQQHHSWHDTSLAGVTVDYKANQFVMNLGVAVPF